MLKKSLVACSLALALSSAKAGELEIHRDASASAASNSLGGAAANEIVVTAGRIEERRADVPAEVTTLEKSDMRSVAARNPDDVLGSLSGVSVLRSFGMGYGIPSQINIRGVPGTHRTLLLADGFPLNEASSGFINLNELPLRSLKRIEVVRGPFSVLYGTDALAGVINLRTLDPAELPFLEAAVGVGNEGFYETYAQNAGGDGSIGYSITLDRRSIDNYLAHDRVIESRWDSSSGQYVETTRPAENYDYSDTRILGKIDMDVGAASHLVLNTRFFDSMLGYGQTDIYPLYPVPVDNDTANESAMIGGELSSLLNEKVKSRFAAFYRHQERQLWGLSFSRMNGDVPVFTRGRSENVGYDWEADGGLSIDWRPGHVLVAGVDFHETQVDFSAVEDESSGAVLPYSAGRDAYQDNTGVYLQETDNIGEKTRLVTGARLDMNSVFGSAFSPRVGVVRSLSEDTRLRASAGRAYRAPSLLELYQPAVAFGNAMFVSNPDLRPEYINSADLGCEHSLSKSLSAHCDLFYNDMDDLIADRINGSTITFDNIEEAWSAGVEIGSDWQISDIVGLFANYTFQQSEDKETGADLEYTPENMANAGARISLASGSRLHEATFTERYVGSRQFDDLQTGMRRKLDDYWRADASLRCTFRNAVWIALGAQNLFDEVYQESSVVNPAPGLLWTLELGARYW